jgi:hypothetical protein
MPANRQPELYAAALIPYTAAVVALALRMVARRKTRMMLVWEDYLAIIAFVRCPPLISLYILTTCQSIGSGFTFISLYSESMLFALSGESTDNTRNAMGTRKAFARY